MDKNDLARKTIESESGILMMRKDKLMYIFGNICMTKIQKLSPHEAQKIAAGEVIERPANLLKELLENALDAGSNKIAVYIKDAGKALVRVVDNGCGMSFEDAELAFEQYATSKITSVDDLQAINTFGFRGEALASVAAVAKVTLVTRETNAPEGIKLSLEQSKLLHKEVVCAATGTDIAVEDLFYNVPARRKFLKKSETEWHAIKRLFSALAMTHLDVDFKLYQDDRLVLVCPITDSLQERWTQLFDHTMHKHMLPVVHHDASVKIAGLISDRYLQRYDRNHIYICVNRRWVHDVHLTRAFIKGYQQVLQPARYPAGALFIEIDPKEIDVNIHPRKQEVQFMHPRIVERALQATISRALEVDSTVQTHKHNPSQEPMFTAEPFVAPKQEKGFFTQAVDKPVAIKTGFDPFDFGTFLAGTTQAVINKNEALVSPLQAVQPEKNELIINQQELFDEIDKYEIIGQYHKTYILIEQEDSLCLIDQHAAHERILYEQCMAEHGRAVRVQLLFPQSITMLPEDVELLVSQRELFLDYGIEFDRIGPDVLSICATPVRLNRVPLAELLKDAVASLRSLQDVDAQDIEGELQKKWYADVACKAAVKAGDTLSLEQMRQLIVDLHHTPNRFLCPHGRPTSFVLHLDEIKKKFKRDYKSRVPSLD